MNEHLREKYENMLACYPDVLSFWDITKILGVSGHYVRSMLRNGNLKCLKVLGAYMIPQKFLIDFIISDTYQNRKPN